MMSFNLYNKPIESGSMISISQMKKSNCYAQGHTGRARIQTLGCQLHSWCSPLLQHLLSVMMFLPQNHRILTLHLPLPVVSNVKSSLSNVLRQTQVTARDMETDRPCIRGRLYWPLLTETPRLCSFYILSALDSDAIHVCPVVYS